MSSVTLATTLTNSQLQTQTLSQQHMQQTALQHQHNQHLDQDKLQLQQHQQQQQQQLNQDNQQQQQFLKQNEEAAISSGYSSQDGEALLVNYLSTLKPSAGESSNNLLYNQPQQQLQSSLSNNFAVVSLGNNYEDSRNVSYSQISQVSEHGTLSGILSSTTPQVQLSPSPAIGEIRPSSAVAMLASPRSTKCLSPQCACCQRSDVLARINEELLGHKDQLEERNHGLSEEIQVSRRFYQGTLADLTAQLSIAESRIKYLREVVSTHEEALLSINKGTSLTSASSSPNLLLVDKTEHFAQPPSLSNNHNNNNYNNNMSQNQSHHNGHYPSTTTTATQQQLLQQQRLTKSLPTSPRDVTNSSMAPSVASSVTSEPPRSRLNMKNIAKFKEQLMERNQLLKTDIELLKFKTDVPSSSRTSTSMSSTTTSSSVMGGRKELPALKGKPPPSSRKEWITNSSIDHSEGIEYTEQQRKQPGIGQKPSMTRQSRPKI